MIDAVVIIVNWNGKRFLKKCFNSLKEQTYKNFKVVLVDNGSEDDSVKFVEENYPKVELIKLKENRGFAEGNNVAIRKVMKNKNIRYVLLLNNDTKVVSGWIKELVRTAEKDNEVGMCASKMVLMSNPKIINGTGDMPFRDGIAISRGSNTKDTGQYNSEEEVFGPCAGAALYKRKMLEEVRIGDDYFDSDFFAYFEDVDLAWRCRLAGWKCVYNPEALVYHAVSGTAGLRSPFQVYHSERNRIWLVWKNFPVKNLIFSYLANLARRVQHLEYVMSGKCISKSSQGGLSSFGILLLLIRANFDAHLGIFNQLKKRRHIKKMINLKGIRYDELLDKYSLTLKETVLS